MGEVNASQSAAPVLSAKLIWSSRLIQVYGEYRDLNEPGRQVHSWHGSEQTNLGELGGQEFGAAPMWLRITYLDTNR